MRFLTFVPVVIVLTAHGQAPISAPQPATPVVVRGRVVAAETGDPVPNARITISPQGPGAPVVLTDRDGLFRLSVAARPIRIAAGKTGFTPETVTPTIDGDTPEIRLRRAAAISGRVVDEFGEAVVDARVTVEPAAIQPNAFISVKSTETDDHGDYRVGGFGPGAFFVSVTTIDALATVQENRGGLAFAPSSLKTYFPRATTVADARAVSLDFGDDRTSIDIVVPGSQRGGQPFGIFGGPPGATLVDHPVIDPATIRGQVVDRDGRGLAHAFVRLSLGGLPGPLRAGRADWDGRFEFTDLPAGTFRVAAYVPGFAVSSGDTRVADAFDVPDSGRFATLVPTLLRDGMVITLARLGVIAGRVLDELGSPIEGARVTLLQVKYQGGRRRLVQSDVTPRLTDDHGEYRLHDVPQGRYLVSASVGSVTTADLPGYTRSYFPGTPNLSDARLVTIADGDQSGADIALTPTRTALVSGHIFNAAGEPSMGGRVELRPRARSASTPIDVEVGARLLPDGVFEFPNVPPGEYAIVAERARSNRSAEGEFGSTIVSVVDSDVANLIVRMSAGSSIAGRFTFESERRTRRPARNAIQFSPVGVDADQTPSSVARAEIAEDWTFTMTGINGPRRLDLVNVPSDWMLKQVRAGRIDVTDRVLQFGQKDQSLTDVEVVLTDRLTELSGGIVDDDGRSVVDAHVILFSTDRERWYPDSRFVREVISAQSGLYTVRGIPPGSYYVAAVRRFPSDGDDAWQGAAFLDTLAFRANVVRLGESQREALNLKVVSPR